MSLVEKTENLIRLVKDENLEIVIDCIRSITGYIKKVVNTEIDIATAKSRCSSQKDFIREVERLDKSRRVYHNAAIASTKILNRLCFLYKIERIYTGNIEDRQEVAKFAKKFVDEHIDMELLNKQTGIKKVS